MAIIISLISSGLSLLPRICLVPTKPTRGSRLLSRELDCGGNWSNSFLMAAISRDRSPITASPVSLYCLVLPF